MGFGFKKEISMLIFPQLIYLPLDSFLTQKHHVPLEVKKLVKGINKVKRTKPLTAPVRRFL